jgi:flagellar biosynthesis GTPase FlhF
MAPSKTGLNAEIQSLYRGPLEEFIAARNALASRLRKEKRADDAAEIKALPKPTPSAWAVNQLFERHPGKMDALLGAGKQARAAQREAVSGRGAESLRESIRAARSLSDELRWDAAHILSEGGRTPSRDLVDRIGANLQALAFSPAAAEEASRGWLDRDLDPPGFEVLAGLQLAGSPVVDLAARRQEAKRKEAKTEEKAEKKPPAPPPSRVLHLPKRPDRQAEREAERDKEARRKQEAAEQARQEREAERIRRRVAVAEEKAGKARAEAQSLLDETREAEEAAAEARRQAEEAERAAARVRERYERAAERLARAEEAVREAGEPDA